MPVDGAAFARGLEALEQQDYSGAAREFAESMKDVTHLDDDHNRLASYLGLARTLTGDDSGLLMCRDAAANEQEDGDVFLNLGCAEWFNGNRKRAFDCVSQGLSIEPGNAQLQQAQDRMDGRVSNAIGFLPRENILNRTLGRMRRQNTDMLSVHQILYG